MADVQVIISSDLPVQDFQDERVHAQIFPAARFCDAALGVIQPGIAQRHHIHKRPDNGDEVIFVYTGKFQVRGDFTGSARVFDTDREGPVYISVTASTPCSLENVGTVPVRFFSVFSPPFAQGEIEYVEPL